MKDSLHKLITPGYFNGNPTKELTRLPVWGPTYRVSLGLKIKAFSGGDNDKFLLIGPRHPLIAINNQSLYIQTKLNSNNAGWSFKPSLNKWFNIVVSQYIEDNDVRNSFQHRRIL